MIKVALLATYTNLNVRTMAVSEKSNCLGVTQVFPDVTDVQLGGPSHTARVLITEDGKASLHIHGRLKQTFTSTSSSLQSSKSHSPNVTVPVVKLY